MFFYENTRRLACGVLHPLKRFRLGEVDDDVFRFLEDDCRISREDREVLALTRWWFHFFNVHSYLGK